MHLLAAPPACRSEERQPARGLFTREANMDPADFDSLIAHLPPAELPRLARLLERFVEAREAAKTAWRKRENHFNGQLQDAVVAMCQARAPVWTMCPSLPEEWGRLPGLGTYPPDPRLQDAAGAILRSFLQAVHAAALPEGHQYVKLDQIAAIVSHGKRTLERLKGRQPNPLPDPDIEGGGGKADEWRWDRIRPWLEAEYKRSLPEQFPGWRR
jgi:hypothetical protein